MVLGGAMITTDWIFGILKHPDMFGRRRVIILHIQIAPAYPIKLKMVPTTVGNYVGFYRILNAPRARTQLGVIFAVVGHAEVLQRGTLLITSHVQPDFLEVLVVAIVINTPREPRKGLASKITSALLELNHIWVGVVLYVQRVLRIQD
jgi:hypothetical protein